MGEKSPKTASPKTAKPPSSETQFHVFSKMMIYGHQSNRRTGLLKIDSLLCLDSVPPLRKMRSLLGGTGGHLRLFAISKCTADGTGLFGTEVLGQVFRVLQKFTGPLTLGLVVHGEDTGNRLAHLLYLDELGGGAAGHLGDTELSELRFEVIELLEQVCPRLTAQI